MRIHKGVAKGTTGIGADLSRAVAVIIRGGRADERDIDLQLTRLDGAGACTVSAQNDGIFHLASQHGVAKLAADTAGLDAVNRTVANKVYNGGILDVNNGTGGKAQVFDVKFADGRKYLDNDHIALAERVVERNGHTVT